MSTKAKVLPAIVIVLLGVAAYRLFSEPATVDAPINSYLIGEMAKLTLPETPQSLSSHIIMRADGSPVALKELAGKVMLINLWAPWCAPCRAEMKELAALEEQLGDDDFEVVAINVNRGGIPEAEETLKDWGVSGLNLYAEPTMKIAFDLAEGALPTSLVVDKTGAVRALYLGPLKWDAPESLALFKALKTGLI